MQLWRPYPKSVSNGECYNGSRVRCYNGDHIQSQFLMGNVIIGAVFDAIMETIS